MMVLGLTFAFLSESEAILLDGVFSGIGFVMSLATLKVAELVTRPDDEHFNFGYAHFAPLINVVKSLLMTTLCAFAMLSSIQALLGAGRPMHLGSAALYGVVAAVGCIGITLYLKSAAKRTGSPLLSVDAGSWTIDSIMSAAVLLSFVGGYFAQATAWGEHLDYLDPAVVTLLCVVALPVPLRILWDNGREMLLIAPDRAIQDEVIERVEAALAPLPIDDCRVRMLKMGNTLNVMLHVKLAAAFDVRSIKQLDEIRATVHEALAEIDARVAVDLVFIDDMALAD